MIPRIVHYCWFGKGPKSELALQCLENWNSIMKGFQIKEWNESNSDAYKNRFYRDAYRRKEFAFVADCVRVQVLRDFGGIYLDLDMYLIKPLEELLKYRFFTGYEVPGRPAYGIFGGVKGNHFFMEMSSFYDSNRFNPYSKPVITHTFNDLVRPERLRDEEVIFDPEFFYALPYVHREQNFLSFITDKSLAVHLWDHSWGKNGFDKSLQNKSISWILVNLKNVMIDYAIYRYPYAYLKRYIRAFGRELFRRLKERPSK